MLAGHDELVRGHERVPTGWQDAYLEKGLSDERRRRVAVANVGRCGGRWCPFCVTCSATVGQGSSGDRDFGTLGNWVNRARAAREGARRAGKPRLAGAERLRAEVAEPRAERDILKFSVVPYSRVNSALLPLSVSQGELNRPDWQRPPATWRLQPCQPTRSISQRSQRRLEGEAPRLSGLRDRGHRPLNQYSVP